MDKKTQQMSAWYFIAAITILVLFVQSFLVTANVETINYSQFNSLLKKGQISDVVIGETTIRGTLKPEALNEILSQERIKALGEKAKTPHPFVAVRVADSALTAELEEASIPFKGEVASNWLTMLLSWLVPVVIFFVVWGFLLNRMGAGGGMMQIGKSKAKVYIEKQTGGSFADVEGIDEAKEELIEVVEFLKHPEKYQRLGGHIPKGVLIVGPPGTGKILLARAVAGGGRSAVFQHHGLRFRRDVRRRGRGSGARSVRPSGRAGAEHHFYR
jgi:cell division protease FtsH